MNSKIQDLLHKAAVISDSSADKMSSVTQAKRKFADETQAKKCFTELSEKLFQIRKWNADSGLSSYELFDETGNVSARETAKTGDFIKITLAGSGKSDWVKITGIDNAPDEIVLTVQPSYNPTEDAPDKQVTSHFFTSESTNNFCLQRVGDTLNFYVVGLNEKSNTSDTGNIIETARNVATANIGHYLGIQKAEWTTFCANFLEIGEDK